MAELTHTNVPIHVMKDAEGGLYHFMAEIEGALIPFATQKIGHVESWIKNADKMSVKAPGAKKATTKKPAASASDSE